MELVDLVKLLIAVQLTLAGMFGWHLFKCRDTRVDIATIKGAVARIEHDIGDHERGIRGQLHQHSQALTRHELDLALVRNSR